jgi:hypothetical protein
MCAAGSKPKIEIGDDDVRLKFFQRGDGFRGSRTRPDIDA